MLNYEDSDIKLKEFGQVKFCSRYDLAKKQHHDIDSNIVQIFLALFSGGLSMIYSMWSSLFTLISDPEASPTWKAWCHDLKPHFPHANGYSWKLYCINSKILCFAVSWRFKKTIPQQLNCWQSKKPPRYLVVRVNLLLLEALQTAGRMSPLPQEEMGSRGMWASRCRHGAMTSTAW